MSFYLELIGYIASILVAISLTMRSVLRLRLINLVGAAVFTLYGLLINAYPVAFMNGLIILINLYYLYQMTQTKAYFQLMEVKSDSDYLHRFLTFYQDDIQTIVPDYRFEPDSKQLIVFVLRDMIPAGLFIGQRHESGTLRVQLDYVIPQYRDFKIGRFLFQQDQFWQGQQVRQLVNVPHDAGHEAYLRRMGFEQQGEGYLLQL